MTSEFFMIAADKGASPATRYDSLDEAVEVAEELAGRVGSNVYVLQTVAAGVVHRVEWTGLESAAEHSRGEGA